MIDRVAKTSPSKTDGASPIVVAEDLVIRRGQRAVCRGVNLTLTRGTCLGIIGPNASGKSTLLQGLRGLLPVEGRIRLDGIDPTRSRRLEVARKVAVVPQRFEFSCPYTVEDMVLLGRAPHRRPWEAFRGEDREAVRQLLKRLGLLALAPVRVDAISGGERRKVFLARALAQETPLLFLDEPTAGLDPPAQEDLCELIVRERHVAKTIVIVLHDVRLAGRLCETVLGLRDGDVLFLGPPADVLQPEALRRLFDVDWETYSRDGRPPVLLPKRMEDETC